MLNIQVPIATVCTHWCEISPFTLKYGIDVVNRTGLSG